MAPGLGANLFRARGKTPHQYFPDEFQLIDLYHGRIPLFDV